MSSIKKHIMRMFIWELINFAMAFVDISTTNYFDNSANTQDGLRVNGTAYIVKLNI